MSFRIEYGFLLFFSTIIDYISAKKIHNENNAAKRKKYLLTSITLNLGLLFTFKYFLFFVKDYFYGNLLFLSKIPDYWFILPIGISFYTFQTMGYTIDVYKKRILPEKSFIDFSLFVSFFPQLVAGPIERASRILPQLKEKNLFNIDNAVFGIKRILIGFFKKIVIANSMVFFVNAIFDNIYQFSGWRLIVATCFFSNQVYNDFSGYADIAVGSAKLFNIKVIENFRFPMFSRSITDFFSRWHISLTNWFKTYLFPVLSPRGSSKLRMLVSVSVILILSGIWHGAKLSYILWGILFSIFFILSAITTELKKRFIFFFRFGKKLKFIIDIITTNILLIFASGFFRANTPEEAIYLAINCWNEFFNGLYYLITNGLQSFFIKYIKIDNFTYENFQILIFLSIITPIFHLWLSKEIKLTWLNPKIKHFLENILYTILFFTIIIFSIFSPVDFIYFRF
ncbi:MAG: MBOAT family protein [Candidatus Muirbacterium halophilum]|nr:MBOAT family protein [Candidatus Muirbacterium halophilum]